MTWDLAGTEEHHFDAPVQIDLNDSTNGAGTPVTAEPGGAWHAIPELATPGTLPGAWQDGYWRTGNVVHILTRHLSLFAILTGIVSDANAAPRDFAAVSRYDGLTLRWAPGIPQVRMFVLYADGQPIAQFGGEQFEVEARPDRGRRHASLHADRDQPARASRARPRLCCAPCRRSPASRRLRLPQALAARGFTVGKLVQVSAPGVPAGTVVGPTGVRVQEEGTAVDLQVASAPLSAARSRCRSRSPRRSRALDAARSPLGSRSPIARASTSRSTRSRTGACSAGTSSTSSRGDDPDPEARCTRCRRAPTTLHWKATSDVDRRSSSARSRRSA